MSRNFELLQQLRKQLDAVPIIEPVGIAPVVDKSKVGHPRIVGFDPNCSTPEVLHKFVENVFLSRGKLSPRLVAFAGLESGDCCSRMITELAVTLTRLDIGKVCLVDAYCPRIFRTSATRGSSVDCPRMLKYER